MERHPQGGHRRRPERVGFRRGSDPSSHAKGERQMTVVRDFQYEMRAINRTHEIDPFVADLAYELSSLYDDTQRQMTKLRDTARDRSTVPGRSYLANAAVSVS